MSKSADKMQRDVKRAKETLNRLTPELITDLVRRAGTRSTGEKASQGPKGKGSHSDPTLAAVVRHLSTAKPSDPVFDTVKELAQTLADITQLAIKIDDKLKFVLEAGERSKNNEVPTCMACGEITMRPRSGYCPADYQAWLRAGRPYRASFEADRRAKAQ
jgi:hypothetical protein